MEDEYDSYSEKKQQEIEALLGNLTEIIGEVVEADQSNQNYIKETLNHRFSKYWRQKNGDKKNRNRRRNTTNKLR